MRYILFLKNGVKKGIATINKHTFPKGSDIPFLKREKESGEN